MAVHGTLAIVIGFVLPTLSTVIVGLRFYSRYFLVGKLSSPDYVMLLALLATWFSSAVNYECIHYLDYSRAMKDGIVTDYLILGDIMTGALLWMWIYRLNYLIDLCLIKVSILLFYQYVTSAHKSFHLITRGMLAFVVVGSFSMTIASIFVCRPPEDAWSLEVFLNGTRGIYDYKCYNPQILWYFSAGYHLLTDIFIWILPIPFFLNLRTMPIRRRLELVAIFSIGMVAIAASAVRLYVVILWNSGFSESGANYGNLMIWGQVEQHAGIVSASIPFLRPIIRKAFSAGRKDPNPGPAAALLHPNTPPAPIRTPIIPSPSPTLGSDSSRFKAPPSPLSPIIPIKAEVHAGFTV